MNDTSSNDLSLVVAQAIEEIKSEQGLEFSKEKINLAELERRTGISRGKLRRLKANGFKDTPHGLSGRRNRPSVLMGYESVLDGYFRKGIRNSSVCLDALREMGYTGGQTTVRDCLRAHLDPMPAKRQAVEPQGNRGRRYSTDPGHSYQMEWGFTTVDVKEAGEVFTTACFAMICHHCGQRYVEFFPNAMPGTWRNKFNEDVSLLCALDRIFDDAMLFKLRGQSHRGKRLETIALTTSRSKMSVSSETSTID